MIAGANSVWKQESIGLDPQVRKRDPDFLLGSSQHPCLLFPRPMFRATDTSRIRGNLDARITSGVGQAAPSAPDLNRFCSVATGDY